MRRVSILGSGNIGFDLLVKCREKNVEVLIFNGRHPRSKGLGFASRLGVKTSAKSIEETIDTNTVVVPSVKSVLQTDGSFKSGSLINLEPSPE